MTKRYLSKTEFYILSFTWGIIMTTLGCLVSIVLIIFGFKPQKNSYGWVFHVGNGGSGVSFGPLAIVQKPASEYILQHEFGHAIQNCIFGPFKPFLVSIPSAIRYWYRYAVIVLKIKTINELPDYDSIWFEGMATRLGKQYWGLDT